MKTIHRTLSWIVTMEDSKVVDLTSDDPAIQGNTTHKARVITAINEDVAAGVAPPDPATWGFEFEEYPAHLYQGDPVDLSYLRLVWADPTPGRADVVRRMAEFLADFLRDGVGELRFHTTADYAGVFTEDARRVLFYLDESRGNGTFTVHARFVDMDDERLRAALLELEGEKLIEGDVFIRRVCITQRGHVVANKIRYQLRARPAA